MVLWPSFWQNTTAKMEAIHHLASLDYCDRIAWSTPIPTGRSGEYISVMTRRQGATTGG
ncbi:hypothetical protein [Nodosilinea sp. LEGE 07298]|uniref:hypothetical protein n=1 Tax=Nodosilinea sp. LEGE 07298 TaxID=2777970 RepID=UPI00187F3211|nr:hypothetical protein [Nodosilinea sp. LEGE 07298]